MHKLISIVVHSGNSREVVLKGHGKLLPNDITVEKRYGIFLAHFCQHLISSHILLPVKLPWIYLGAPLVSMGSQKYWSYPWPFCTLTFPLSLQTNRESSRLYGFLDSYHPVNWQISLVLSGGVWWTLETRLLELIYPLRGRQEAKLRDPANRGCAYMWTKLSSPHPAGNVSMSIYQGKLCTY